MGRRKKEQIMDDMIVSNGMLAPAPRKDDNLAKMSVEARKQHMSYGQLQAKKYASQIDFTIGYMLQDQLKTIRERLQEKEEGESSKNKPEKSNEEAS